MCFASFRARGFKMGRPGIKSCSDEDFIKLFKQHGASQVSRILGITERNVHKRRRNLERFSPIAAPSEADTVVSHPDRVQIEIKNGSVLIGSDFHLWPGYESTALKAFKKICADIKPQAVILNGDVLDFPAISRHPPMGWESIPLPFEEIEC